MPKLPLTNTQANYGLVHILLHWLMAIGIIGLYFLGLYIVDLDYYSRWYQTAPHIHRSLGVIIGMVLIFRFIWRISNPHPRTLGKAWEVNLANLLHWCLYILIATIVVSGYLITTAAGQPVLVFDWFAVPVTVTSIEQQEDLAGMIHEWLAHFLIALVVVHASAAIKHHLIDKDATLTRMLGR